MDRGVGTRDYWIVGWELEAIGSWELEAIGSWGGNKRLLIVGWMRWRDQDMRHCAEDCHYSYTEFPTLNSIMQSQFINNMIIDDITHHK